jgi:recombination endonuclease VII
MSLTSNNFVFVKWDRRTSDNVSVEQDDVGIIIEPESKTSYIVFIVRIWKKVKLNIKDLEFFDVTKTGDAFHSKICNICHKLLPTTNFARNQNGINNRPVRRPSCQECRKQLEGKNLPAEIRREWAKKKPRNVPFECPICNKRTIAGVTSKIVLDHNHHTGEVRGWICDSCNTGLGRFKDDLELLKKAIKYLG